MAGSRDNLTMRVKTLPTVASTPIAFSDAQQASTRLQAAGISSATLAAQFPGAFIRRLHTVAARVHVGVDPRGNDFAAIGAWLKDTGAKVGLDVRSESSPTKECCGAGCGGCLTNTAAPKELRTQWLKSSAPKTTAAKGYAEESQFERR